MNYTIVKYIGVATLSCLMTTLPLMAQEVKEEKEVVEESHGAWEIGIGGAGINLNRVTLTGYSNANDAHNFDMQVNHLMGGPTLYVAREILPWLYVDLQGTVGMVKSNHPDNVDNHKLDLLYMGGLGLQVRPFGNKYVEPYLRAGINYLHKDFNTVYSGGFENDPTGQAHWQSTDTWNPNGGTVDKESFFPISLGVGVNSWLSDCFGLGLQGEYLLPTQKGLPHFVEVSARVMWRIGGKTKRALPRVEYVEVIKPVEKIVEKIVEVPVQPDKLAPEVTMVCDLMDKVHFEFDKDEITTESGVILDRLAELLKAHPGEHFLLTGYTDARGSHAYNIDLSQRRAKRVLDALVERGVEASMLKSRGAGKRISVIPASGDNKTREGDRKVLIERITNDSYWESL